MKTMLVASTALTLTLAAPATAQDSDFTYTATGDELEASGFIGARVYTAETDTTGSDVPAETAGDRQDWNDIGEVHDILMSPDGGIQAVLVDIGGFLGIGEKQVAVAMDALSLNSDRDDADEYFVVFNSTREALEDAPEFEMPEEGENMAQADASDTDAMTGAEATGGAAMAENETTGAADDDQQMARDGGNMEAPEIERDGYTRVTADELSADELTGVTVYGADDEPLGDVHDLIVSDGGQIQEAIIDVGGFLGIGEKPVAMGFDRLNIQRNDDNDDVRVYINADEESLEEMPEHEG